MKDNYEPSDSEDEYSENEKNSWIRCVKKESELGQ